VDVNGRVAQIVALAISRLVTLVPVLDRTAVIPVFVAVTAGLCRKQSLVVATYAVGIAFLVLVFYIVVGQLLLEAL
jgi:multiple antibiotic resistance protein